MNSVHREILALLISLCFYQYLAVDSPYASPEALIRPAVIIFDPDNTIWPFKVEDVIPPLVIKNENVILDQEYKHLKPYRQVPGLFQELHRRGHQLAIISQSAQNDTVCQLLAFFGLDKFVTYKEIYPGNRTEHLEAVHIKSDIYYGDMMYIEDEFEDINDATDLGMVCILVGKQGVTMKDISKGFHIFSTESPEYSYSEDTHESSYLHKE